VGLSVVALLAVIYGIKELARHGLQAGLGVALAVGLVLGVLFVRRQRRLVEPLLDLSLFSNRVITATLVNQLAFSAVGAGLLLLMLLHFQLVDGMSTLNAALAVVPGMLVAAAGMQLAPKLGARFRPAHVMGGGMFMAALVYVGLTQVSVDNGTWMLIVGFVLASLFGAPAVILGTGLVVSNAPPEKMGSAGSVAQLSNEFGGTLGLALLGTVAAAVYRGTVTVPPDVPDEPAAVAGDSLAGAATIAPSLPTGQAQALMDSAVHAFVTGIQVVAVIGAVLVHHHRPPSPVAAQEHPPIRAAPRRSTGRPSTDGTEVIVSSPVQVQRRPSGRYLFVVWPNGAVRWRPDEGSH
jgi:DHA2 family multidrug resistance protein-like MFS transporter